jgi:hypothetical protein
MLPDSFLGPEATSRENSGEWVASSIVLSTTGFGNNKVTDCTVEIVNTRNLKRKDEKRMDYRLTSQRTRSVAIGLVCVVVAGMTLWAGYPLGKSLYASARKTNQTDRSRVRLQAGVGGQVSFAQHASEDEARASVDSIDRFIAGRSGLKLDPDSKGKLVQMESETVSGQRRHVTVSRYVKALADTLSERLASLTDDEIDYASAIMKNNGRIALRFNGRFGVTDDEFPAEAKKLREQSRSGDPVIRRAIQDGLGQEVEKRISVLGDALPGQFAAAGSEGLTPAQAVLITYSVITDDDLALTRRQIASLAKNPALRLHAADGTIPANATVYGPNGRFFATPADLIFNSATISSLLDRLGKGGN